MEGPDSDERENVRPLRRLDSLDVEANRVPDGTHSSSKVMSTAVILTLAYESLGVIYGDVGTSPLYVYSSTFLNFTPRKNDVLGALSLIIYTLSLIPLLKYVVFVLNANDNGNGGTFALYSLICRHAKVSQLRNEQVEDRSLSTYSLQIPERSSTRGARIKAALEGSPLAKRGLLFLTLLGTCAVIGDGVLTPVISVISAVDGIQTKDPDLTNDHVVLISVAILIVLFSLQRCGTEKVSFIFAPCVLVWFLFIGGIGIFNTIKHDANILRAFNPYYLFNYFRINGKQGWISLGGIVLAMTGTEAMFADLGHFSVPSIRIAFSIFVYPSLLCAYIGQGAYLLRFPEDVSQTFYKSIPEPMFWPMFVVAIGAAVIASQAMISAVFSIVEQSVALGCLPTVRVIHTSPKYMGQVYIPEVNWLLMVLCVIVAAIFKTTAYIGNAYGMAVLAVMLVTTTLVTLIMLMIWQKKLIFAITFFVVFASIEMVYFSANLYKFTEGGWLPVAFASFLVVIMAVWHYVTTQKYIYETEHKVSMSSLASRLETDLRLNRVPGIGLMYSQLVQGVPPIFDLFVDNLRAIHSVLVFVTVKHLPVSTVPLQERFLVRRVGSKEYRMYRSVVRYGYMDASTPHQDFEALLIDSLKMFVEAEAHELETLDQGLYQEQSNANKDVEQLEKSGSLARTSDLAHGKRKSNGSENSEDKQRLSNSILEKQPSNASRNSEATGIATFLAEREEELRREVDFLVLASGEGVTYLLGNSVVEAAPASSIGKRLVVNVLYDLLQRLSRKRRVALLIPHKKLMEVGITYSL